MAELTHDVSKKEAGTSAETEMIRNEWSEERRHIETVLIERFNFFIVFLGVILTGAVTTQSQSARFGMLLIGLCVCLPISWTLWRAQRKFDFAFQQIEDKYPNHPAIISSKKIGGRSVRWLIGKGIPQACNLILAACLWTSLHPEYFRSLRQWLSR